MLRGMPPTFTSLVTQNSTRAASSNASRAIPNWRCRVLVLDIQTASVRLRRRLCVRCCNCIESCIVSLDDADAIRTGRVPFLRGACASGALRYGRGRKARRHLESLAEHLKQIAIWADNCPVTFANRAALVVAEIARLEGRELDAERLYEEAIRFAREQGFIQNEGLANELPRISMRRRLREVRAPLSAGRPRLLSPMGRARQGQATQRTLPAFAGGRPPASGAATIGAPAAQLDVETVVKASQAVSGEIVLENLIKTLMMIAVEHAGAERGLLILPRGDQLWVEAEATTGLKTVEVNLRQALVAPAELPLSLLQYVIRTQEPVISTTPPGKSRSRRTNTSLPAASDPSSVCR